MKDSYLSLFRAPGSHRRLSFAGEREGNELLNGKLLADGEEVGRISDGIISFVEADPWPRDLLEEIRSSQQISRNWENSIEQAHTNLDRRDICDDLAAVKGTILEVAVGPGGGNMPPVLSRNPEAMLIVNDISEGVLKLWRDFLAERKMGRSLCFAAFDARNMPIRSESISAVSNLCGFGNIDRGHEAIQEAVRVLEPGGELFSVEFVVDPDGWVRIPEEVRKEYDEHHPIFTRGSEELLRQAGLSVESRKLLPGRKLVPEQDEVAQVAAKYGVTLYASFEYVRARKI